MNHLLRFSFYLWLMTTCTQFVHISDVTTYAKVIGGGLPVGAFGGRKEIMEIVAPAGPMYEVRKMNGLLRVHNRIR